MELPMARIAMRVSISRRASLWMLPEIFSLLTRSTMPFVKLARAAPIGSSSLSLEAPGTRAALMGPIVQLGSIIRTELPQTRSEIFTLRMRITPLFARSVLLGRTGWFSRWQDWQAIVELLMARTLRLGLMDQRV